MTRLRGIEQVTGMEAGQLGALGLAHVSLGPTYRNSTGETRNLVEMNGPKMLWVIAVLPATVAVIAAPVRCG